MDGGAWWAAAHGVAKSRTRLSDFTFTFHFHALEKEMATHSSVLAWRVPGMGEPGGLPSMGSHRVRHDWSDLTAEEGFNAISRRGHRKGRNWYFRKLKFKASSFKTKKIKYENLNSYLNVNILETLRATRGHYYVTQPLSAKCHRWAMFGYHRISFLPFVLCQHSLHLLSLAFHLFWVLLPGKSPFLLETFFEDNWAVHHPCSCLCSSQWLTQSWLSFLNLGAYPGPL